MAETIGDKIMSFYFKIVNSGRIDGDDGIYSTFKKGLDTQVVNVPLSNRNQF
jgi:hypothetical protein